jgi:hypothetical protein
MTIYDQTGSRFPFPPLPQPVRRTVFISFAQSDRTEVNAFVYRWTQQDRVFIPKAVGVAFGDDLIDSDDSDYVIGRIRRDYLSDSTITLVLIGRCTHSRRFVDWEIKASLRQGQNYTPNGLLGILLPSAGGSAYLPPRFAANWNSQERDCYARFRNAPGSAQELGNWLEDAFDARTRRAQFISNSADIMKYNAVCKVHNITHPSTLSQAFPSVICHPNSGAKPGQNLITVMRDRRQRLSVRLVRKYTASGYTIFSRKFRQQS